MHFFILRVSKDRASNPLVTIAYLLRDIDILLFLFFAVVVASRNGINLKAWKYFNMRRYQGFSVEMR